MVVQGANRNTEPNPVFHTDAPEMNHKEATLPKANHTTLSQLRSRNCIALKTDLNVIGITRSPNCPKCGDDIPTHHQIILK